MASVIPNNLPNVFKCAQLNLHHATIPSASFFHNVEFNDDEPFIGFVQEPYCEKGIPHFLPGNCKSFYSSALPDPRAILTISRTIYWTASSSRLAFLIVIWTRVPLTCQLVGCTLHLCTWTQTHILYPLLSWSLEVSEILSDAQTPPDYSHWLQCPPHCMGQQNYSS